MYKPALTVGLLFGALAVMMGAFAAHGLDAMLPPEKIAIFQKGVTYQFYHCFALLITGILYGSFPVKNLKIAVLCFIFGIVFFSGSLYLFPLLEVKNIDIPRVARLVTPLGGVFLIAGWLIAFSVIIKKNR